MNRIFLACVLAGCLQHPKAQTGNDKLLLEAENKLKTGTADVSAILTDNEYLSIHPLTAFRELIRKHSKPAVLRIAPENERGKKISVTGIVTGSDGSPVSGALVYLYQTDAKGWYSADAPHVGGNSGDMNHARLFGYVQTDASGKFELHTIKPSGYPQSDLPAHIHVHVWAEGYRNFVNEFLFDDDERLTGSIREQAVRNRFLIQKPEKANAPFEQHFSYRITLDK